MKYDCCQNEAELDPDRCLDAYRFCPLSKPHFSVKFSSAAIFFLSLKVFWAKDYSTYKTTEQRAELALRDWRASPTGQFAVRCNCQHLLSNRCVCPSVCLTSCFSLLYVT